MHRLDPITDAASDAIDWTGATWIGEIDEGELDCAHLEVVGGYKFQRARLLVWDDDQARGFVEVPLIDGSLDVTNLRVDVAKLPQVKARDAEWELLPVSVVVCTRDHPDDLRGVLESLCCLDYPQFELLVVDNNPASQLTPPVVDSFADTRIRLVNAAGRGLAIARNVGIKNAQYGIIAFTDDDVIVDRRWLKNLAYGFAQNKRVACVCGMAASAELITAAQSYFDRRARVWAHCESAVYDFETPPDDEPLFPLRVGAFGTGANFAVRREVVRELGGFDEGLGIGSPTGGGEDVDMFVRVLLAGYLLVREPSAVVWHRHRRTAEELKVQIRNYGLGLGAWSFKLLCRPRTFGMVISRLRLGFSHLRGFTGVDQEDAVRHDVGLDGLNHHEVKGILGGPLALVRARIAGRAPAPLKTKSANPLSLLNFRRGQMWGDPGNTIATGRFALVAAVLGLIGLIGAIPQLPSFMLAIVVAPFMLAGPGCLALSWYGHLPPYVTIPLVPAVSLAICILVVSGLLMLGFYSPVVVLLGIATATVLGGLLRCSYLAHRKTVNAA